MFQTNSRYIDIGDSSIQTKDGKTIVYKKRRFLPNSLNTTLVQEIQVTKGDRLDQIATRIIGDPEQFWRICDSNNIMHPLELTRDSGSTIKITRLWS